MFKNQTLTVVLPAFNEGANISKFITEIKDLKIVDEIIAVNNNSTDNTEQEIKKNDVVYINANKQEFGAAVKEGLKQCKTELIIICEPDGSFQAKDILVILEYINQFDAVFTSRTGSMQNFYLKYGNMMYAKVLSFIFRGPKLTDVGSSLRLFKKNDLLKFIHRLKSDGPELQIELTINFFKQNTKIVEVPIKYFNRVGISNYTGNFLGSLKVAIKFTKVVISKFF